MAVPVQRSLTQTALTLAPQSASDTEIGDLVIVWSWSQGTVIPDHTLQGGFTEIRTHSHDDGSTDGRLSCAYKVATSSGVQTYQAYTSANATANQEASGIIVIQKNTFAVGVLPVSTSTTKTNNTPPDPGQLTGLTGDFKVFAIGAWHVTSAGSTATSPGANYNEQLDGPTGSHVTHLAVATRDLTGLSSSSEDPAAFTDNVTPNGTVSMSIALKGTVESGALLSTIGAATDVASSVREVLSGTLLETIGAEITVVDSIVTPGFTEHFSGQLTVDIGASSVVASSVRETFSGQLNSDIGASEVVASTLRETFSTSAVDIGASVVVAATVKETFSTVQSAIGAAEDIASSVRETFSAASSEVGASVVVASSVREVLSAVSSEVAASTTVAATTRETFSMATVDVGASTVIEATVRETFSGALLETIGAEITVVSSNVGGAEHTSGPLLVSISASSTVASSVRETFGGPLDVTVGSVSDVSSSVLEVMSGPVLVTAVMGVEANGFAEVMSGPIGVTVGASINVTGEMYKRTTLTGKLTRPRTRGGRRGRTRGNP